MNIQEIMNSIHEIEETIPVQEWSYNGIDIWPILRSQIYFDLFNKHNFVIIDEKRSFCSIAMKILRKTVHYLSDFINSMYRFMMLKKADVFFLADQSFTLWGGKYYQRFVDPEREFLSKKGKSTISVIVHPIRKNPLESPITNFFTFFLIAKICSRIYIYFLSDKELPKSIDMLNKHLEKIGLQEFSSKSLKKLFAKYQCLSKFYQILLKKVSPSACFVVSYYENTNMAFIHACRKLDIPVTDIQHGVINDFHACYGGFRNVPKNGYNTMPSFFACWDKLSAECINKWAQHTDGNHLGIVHGNNFMRKVLTQPNLFVPVFKAIQNSHAPAYNILLSLQTNYDLTDFLKKLLEISPNSYFWWIRFHPMHSIQEQEKIKSILVKFPKLKFDTESTSIYALYGILPLMDAHVTLNSSVVIEAGQFGVPSIVCEETGLTYYQSEIHNELVYSAPRPEDAIQLVTTVRKKDYKIETLTAETL